MTAFSRRILIKSRLRAQRDEELIAPPCNPALSTEPNKSQTIVNIVKAEGPMTRAELLARMQELLGPQLATKPKISSLTYQLLMGHPPRIELDYDTGMLSSTETESEEAAS